MKIETTYSVGDTVFYMYHNNVIEDKISKISITIDDKQYYMPYPSVIYGVYKSVALGYRENQIFKTKEELIKSL